MEDGNNELVTKQYLSKALSGAVKGLRAEFKGDLKEATDGLRAELVVAMNEMKDQILSAFKMTEETIRKESAHADEVAGLDARVQRLENHVGINEQ